MDKQELENLIAKSKELDKITDYDKLDYENKIDKHIEKLKAQGYLLLKTLEDNPEELIASPMIACFFLVDFLTAIKEKNIKNKDSAILVMITSLTRSLFVITNGTKSHEEIEMALIKSIEWAKKLADSELNPSDKANV